MATGKKAKHEKLLDLTPQANDPPSVIMCLNMQPQLLEQFLMQLPIAVAEKLHVFIRAQRQGERVMTMIMGDMLCLKAVQDH